MSDTLQLPEVDQALGMLDSVYADVYFSKMAEFGYVPQTQDDAIAMLQTAVQLDAIPEQPTIKQASTSPYVDAHSRLQQVLVANGMVDPGATKTAQVKSAAFALATHPELYKAALAVKAAEAAALEENNTETA